MRKLFLVMAAIALLCVGAIAQAEVVGGFNGSWDGWNPIGSTMQSSAYTLGAPTEGSKFALMDSTDGSPYVPLGTNWYAGIEKTFTLTETSILSFEVAYANSGASEIGFETGTGSPKATFTGSSAGWGSSGPYTLNAGVHKIVFYSTQGFDYPVPTGPNWLAVDNVQISTVNDAAVPEPFSIMLGMMGLGSVAGFRRLRKA